jgi:hypothetical protein
MPTDLEAVSARKRAAQAQAQTARFAGHHEAREALVLAVAGVTSIMLIANLILLVLY